MRKIIYVLDFILLLFVVYFSYCFYVFLNQDKVIAQCHADYNKSQPTEISYVDECDNIKRSFLQILSQKPIKSNFIE